MTPEHVIELLSNLVSANPEVAAITLVALVAIVFATLLIMTFRGLRGRRRLGRVQILGLPIVVALLLHAFDKGWLSEDDPINNWAVACFVLVYVTEMVSNLSTPGLTTFRPPKFENDSYVRHVRSLRYWRRITLVPAMLMCVALPLGFRVLRRAVAEEMIGDRVMFLAGLIMFGLYGFTTIGVLVTTVRRELLPVNWQPCYHHGKDSKVWFAVLRGK